jgi:hypothetical protein
MYRLESRNRSTQFSRQDASPLNNQYVLRSVYGKENTRATERGASVGGGGGWVNRGGRSTMFGEQRTSTHLENLVLIPPVIHLQSASNSCLALVLSSQTRLFRDLLADCWTTCSGLCDGPKLILTCSSLSISPARCSNSTRSCKRNR